MTTSPVESAANATARGILEAASDERIVISLPHSDYRLSLAPSVPATHIAVAVGKHISGTIHAKALRMFKAEGGGQFIEPLEGAPRIVAGRVAHVDIANRRLLINIAAPMWVTLAAGDSPDMFAVGDMVNCYVESGATFTPA